MQAMIGDLLLKLRQCFCIHDYQFRGSFTPPDTPICQSRTTYFYKCEKCGREIVR